jgi:uncharacterized GH25 family protein
MIQVTDPAQKVSTIEAYTDSVGLFLYYFEVFETGQWKIRVEYSGDNTHIETSFETYFQVNQVQGSLLTNTTIIVIFLMALVMVIFLVSKL